MRTKEGEQLAVANALYTLLNIEKRVPAKPDAQLIEGYKLGEKLDMDYQPRKILFTGEGIPRDPVTAVRHHIDTNNHVNNAQYVDMACDLLPGGFTIGRILVSYHISAVRGDELYPFVHEGEDTFGVDLRRKDGESFCKVLFQTPAAL